MTISLCWVSIDGAVGIRAVPLIQPSSWTSSQAVTCEFILENSSSLLLRVNKYTAQLTMCTVLLSLGHRENRKKAQALSELSSQFCDFKLYSKSRVLKISDTVLMSSD